MTALRRGSARVALGLAALWLAAGPTPAATPSVRGQWIQVQQGSIQLFSNTGPAETHQLAMQLAGLRNTLTVFLPGFRIDPTHQTRIYLFENRRTFTRYADLIGAPRRIDALFAETPQCHFVLVHAGSRTNSSGLLFHEYLHQVVSQNVPQTPLWLNEGLAELFSTFWSDGERAEIGLPNPDYLYLLREEETIDLRHVLDVAPRSADYVEPGAKSLFHAQAWLIVHYLVTAGHDLQEVIPSYRQRAASGKPAAEAFAGALSMTVPQLRQALAEHLARKPLPSLKLRTSGQSTRPPLTSRQMAPEEVLFRLGELVALACRDRDDDAERHFRKALEENPDHAPSLAALGGLLTRKGRDEQAAQLLERARALEPGDAAAYYLEGNRLFLPFQSALPPHSAPLPACPPRVREARKAYLRAIELEPATAKAYVAVARTCLFEPARQSACDQLFTKTRNRYPGQGELTYYHLIYLLRHGETGRAQQLYEELKRASPRDPWIPRAEVAMGGETTGR